LSDTDTALPAEPIAGAVASGETTQAAPDQDTHAEGQDGTKAAPETEGEAKPAKTPEQREIDRLRRGIDRRTRQLAEARAQLGLTREPQQQDNRETADDSEPLSLTRAQIRELVTAEAAKLAPTLRDQATEVERRQGVVQSLAKTWGQERFNAVSSDLDDAFGGLTDRSGKPKPAIEAVFEADDPAKVIEFLADPDNVDEAERISKLSAVQAGRAIAQLESRLKTEKRKDEPKASKAPAPLESIRGEGSVSGAPNPADTKAWIRWRNEQERKGL
jgi:hypothetical protein